MLNRFDVSYYLCSDCGSLETEPPYWLDEAYDVSGTGDDVGVAQRTIDLLLKSTALLDLIKLPQDAECIDFGGGLGLFTRLMRDRGWNFLSYDRYAVPFFSDRYSLKSLAGRSPAVVTAFEVLEHFPEPAKDLRQLFASRPALVIATTELFEGQDETWVYLAEGMGQHVFFYSRRAMNRIANAFGYSLVFCGGLIVFLDNAELGRFGISASQAITELRSFSWGRRLMHRGLGLFAEHQKDPSEYVSRDVQEWAGRAQ